MNKIYRLVWNKSLSLWTVVSENARGVTKKRNVTTIQTVTELTSSSLQQNNKLLKLKPSLIALTISTVFLSTGAFAGANMGGGTSNQGSSTAISPTNDQCGSAGQATVNGMPNSVAIGCGSRVNQTNNQVQGIAQRRGGSAQPYPDGTMNHVPSAVAIGNKNVTGAGGGVAIGNANESNASFANVAIGQGNRAIGGGFGTALGIGNLTDGSSNVAIGVANRARGNTAIALGRQTYAEADFAIAQGNTATVAEGATGGIAMGNAATTKGVRGIAIGSGTGGANYDATTAANADGADSVAIGTGAKGTGDGSTAVGRQTVASGESSTAMGDKAKAEGNGDVAIGANAYAKGPNNLSATAVGRNSHAEGEDALAVGNSAKATANYAGAVGNFAQASARNAMAVGNSAKAGGEFSSAFGNFSEASGAQSIASGNSSKATADFSSAYGNFSEASARNATAVGNSANASGEFSSAFGNFSKASGVRSSALGQGATASGADSVATGSNAQANGDSTIATGNNAQAQGENDIAIGRNAATSSGTTDNIAIGHGVTTGDTGQNVAMGSGSTSANAASSEGGAVAIGRDQVARGDGAVAIGDPNNANGNGAVALGRNNTAAGNDDATEAANGAIAIGNENKAIGQGSVALGNQSTAAEAGSIALGDSANAQAARGIALGSNAVATNADDVALGAGSVTSTATGDSFLTGIAAPASVVSVGSAGNERRIQHLSDGAEDTDAVNVRQLKHVKGVVDEQGESTANALGGGSTYDPETGTVSNPTYNINGNDVNNVGDALTELDKGWTLQSNGENAGAVKAGDTVDIGIADGEENLQVEKEGNNIKYSLNRDLKVDSVTAGDTVMNTDGMTIAGGPSVTKSGIDAAGNKITNVAEGTEGTDAVNKDQLDRETAAAKTEVEAGKNMTVESETGADGQTIYTVATADDVEFDSVKVGDVSIDGATGKITGVTAGDVNPDSTDAINGSQLAGTAQSVSDALGGGSTVNPDGTVTAPNYNINGTDVNNVGDALAELDKGWTLQSNGENADAIKAGDTVDIGTADGEENLQVVKEGNDIKYSLNRDLKVDSVTAGDTVMNTDGMTIAGGPSVTKSGIDAGGNKITNVAEGTEGTDAVNKDQLDSAAAAAKTEVEAGKNMTVESETGADGQTIYTVATADDVEFDSVKVGDVSIDGATGKITGVTAGDVNPDSTDAINGSQLAGTAQSVSDALGGGSTVNTDGTVSAPNYNVNGNNVNNVGDALAELDKGWTLQTNGENAAAVKAGDTVDIGTADGEENLQVVKEGNDIRYSLNRDLKIDSVTAGDTVMNTEGMTIAGGPSVTKSGIDAGGNKITNVAEGTEGTDAVNKDQLDQVVADNDARNSKLGESTANALGGGSIYDPETGAISNPNYSVNGNDVNNVGDAIAELDKGWTLQTNGENAAAIKAGDTVDIGTADGEENLQVAKDGNDIKYSLNRDLKVDSVTAGDTVINNEGLTIAGGPSITKDGIDAAGNKITNVAAGTEGTDAVNKDQLDQVVAGNDNRTSKLGESTASGLGGGSTYDPVTGAISSPTYTVNGSDVNNVGDAITALDKGWTLQTNGENAGAVKAGDPVDIGTADGEENLQVAKDGNDIKYSLNRDLKVDSVTAGDTRLDNSGVEVKDAVGNSTTMVAGGTIVKDAQGNSTATTAAGTTIKDVQGNSTILNGTGLAFTDASGAPVGPSVSRTGIDAGGEKITNVAEGEVAADSKDAINGSQLHAQGEGVKDIIGGDTAYDPETGRYTNPNIGGTGKDNLNDAISAVGDAATKAKTTVTEGDNMVVTESTNADGSTNYEVATARDVNFDSVQVGEVNIDSATGKISGVTAGTVSADSTEAINGSQLHAQGEGVKNIIGGDTAYDPETGRYTNPNIGGTGKDNLNDAISAVGDAATKAKTTVTEGDNMVVTESTNADGSTNYEVATARDVNFDSVQVGDVNIDSATGKISGVTAGTVSSDSTEAINGSQLYAQGEGVKNIIGGDTAYDPETGRYTNPNIGGTGKDNLNDAIGAVGEAAKAAKTTVTEGDNIVVSETKNADGSTNYEVATARDVNFDSVKVGGVSIDGTTGKISGVAAGDVNPDSKDAINGSQLAGTAQSVSDALGGGSTVNPDGTVSAPNYNVNGNNVNNVGDALAELDKGWTLQTNGENAAAVKAGDTVDIGTADGEENLQVSKEGNDIKYSLNRDLKVDSVTAGDTVINNEGLTIAGGPSVTRSGIDAGNKKITNVAEGTDGTDAVNKDQLDQVTQASDDKLNHLGESTADGLGGGATFDPRTGAISNPTYTVNGTDVNNVGDAITALDKGWTLQSNGENAAAVKAGDTVDIGTADGEENLQVTKDGNDIKYSLNRDLKVDSVTAGDTVINTDGLTIAGGPSVTKDGIDAGGKKLTNVAPGTVSPDSTDAINGSQLHAQGEGVKNIIGGNTTYDPNTGKYTNPNLGGTGKDNINDAIGAVGDAAKAAKTTVTEGDNIVVSETKNADGSTNYEVATAKDVKFDSVTSTDDEGNETVLTAKGTQVKDGEGNEAEYGAKGITLQDKDGNGTVLNQGGLSFVDPMGNNIGPSITAGGINAGNTVIGGVAAGRVAADSQDAINGGQLRGVSDSVAGAIGGNTTVNDDGTINTSNVGNTGKDNVHDAIDSVRDAAEKAKSTVSEGKNIVVKESKNADGSTDYEVSTSPDMEVDSVTAGDTRVDGDGLHIEGGPSVTKDGIDAGDKKITGVEDGTIAEGSKDAINGGQVKDITDSVRDAIGGNTTVNEDGTINTKDVGGTGHDNINDAIASVKNEAKGAKSTVSKGDDNVKVTARKNDDGSTDYEVGLEDKIKVKEVDADQVNAGQVNVKGDNGSTTITGGGVSVTGPNGEKGPSMTTDGINAGGKKVTGVADGRIEKGSQEAINGGQLHQSYEDVGAALGGGAGYDPEKGWKGPSYNVAGGSYNNVGDALGAIDDRVTNLSDQMQQAFYDTNQRIDDVKKHANAGIAAAMALEAAPYLAGKYTYAVGAAYHGGENAVGVTLRKTADNGRWSLSGGVAAASQGDPSFRVGLSGSFD
ncbi:ESPR-type extended signal peptide-containing protein [Acinetobacter vivianii]